MMAQIHKKIKNNNVNNIYLLTALMCYFFVTTKLFSDDESLHSIRVVFFLA